MARSEIKTDFWVKKLLDDAKIELSPQGGGHIRVRFCS